MMNAIRKAAVLMLLVGGFVFVLTGCGRNDYDQDPAPDPQVQVDDEELAQKTCPVMGLAVVDDIYVDYEGTRVYFCCAGCVGEFEEDPEKYMEIYHEQLGKSPDEVGDADQDHDHDHHHHH